MRRASEWHILSVILAYVGLAAIAAGLVLRIPPAGWTGAGIMVAAATARAACRALRMGSARLVDRLDEARRTAADANARVRELELKIGLIEAERQQAEAMLHQLHDAIADANLTGATKVSGVTSQRVEMPAAESVTTRDVLSDPAVVGLIRELRGSSGVVGRKIVEKQFETPAGRRTFKITLATLCGKERGQDTGGDETVVLVHDVTREKEVSELRNDFVSMVSHEFRTPLASIKAYSEMLIDGEAADAKTVREFHDVINGEANRLGRLIDNVITLSRMESGLIKPELKPHDVGELLAEVLEVAAPHAEARRVRVVSNLAGAARRLANIDRDSLFQATANLVGNAVRHTPEGGQVGVETDVVGAKLRVRITDTGAGIAPADLPFVFDKFYRLEANGKVGSGTGLGLTLARYIIESMHGGRIFAESEIGRGSVFGFEIALQNFENY